MIKTIFLFLILSLVKDEVSFDATVSTCDSVSESYSTLIMLPPDESGTLFGDDCKWCEVPLNRKSYFGEKFNDSDNSSESEYKYYKPRRASSLKTSRTSPSEQKSKAVRFADALGLDLEYHLRGKLQYVFLSTILINVRHFAVIS